MNISALLQPQLQSLRSAAPVPDIDIRLVVSVDADGVMGVDGNMPHVLRRQGQRHAIKDLVQEHAVIVSPLAARAYGGIPPGRRAIVLTRTRHRPEFVPRSTTVAYTPTEALDSCRAHGDRVVYVLGGANVFRAFLPLASSVCRFVLRTAIPIDTVDVVTRFPDHECVPLAPSGETVVAASEFFTVVVEHFGPGAHTADCAQLGSRTDLLPPLCDRRTAYLLAHRRNRHARKLEASRRSKFRTLMHVTTSAATATADRHTPDATQSETSVGWEDASVVLALAKAKAESSALIQSDTTERVIAESKAAEYAQERADFEQACIASYYEELAARSSFAFDYAADTRQIPSTKPNTRSSNGGADDPRHDDDVGTDGEDSYGGMVDDHDADNYDVDNASADNDGDFCFGGDSCDDCDTWSDGECTPDSDDQVIFHEGLFDAGECGDVELSDSCCPLAWLAETNATTVDKIISYLVPADVLALLHTSSATRRTVFPAALDFYANARAEFVRVGADMIGPFALPSALDRAMLVGTLHMQAHVVPHINALVNRFASDVACARMGVELRHDSTRQYMPPRLIERAIVWASELHCASSVEQLVNASLQMAVNCTRYNAWRGLRAPCEAACTAQLGPWLAHALLAPSSDCLPSAKTGAYDDIVRLGTSDAWTPVLSLARAAGCCRSPLLLSVTIALANHLLRRDVAICLSDSVGRATPTQARESGMRGPIAVCLMAEVLSALTSCARPKAYPPAAPRPLGVDSCLAVMSVFSMRGVLADATAPTMRVFYRARVSIPNACLSECIYRQSMRVMGALSHIIDSANVSGARGRCNHALAMLGHVTYCALMSCRPETLACDFIESSLPVMRQLVASFGAGSDAVDVFLDALALARCRCLEPATHLSAIVRSGVVAGHQTAVPSDISFGATVAPGNSLARVEDGHDFAIERADRDDDYDDHMARLYRDEPMLYMRIVGLLDCESLWAFAQASSSSCGRVASALISNRGELETILCRGRVCVWNARHDTHNDISGGAEYDCESECFEPAELNPSQSIALVSLVCSRIHRLSRAASRIDHITVLMQGTDRSRKRQLCPMVPLDKKQESVCAIVREAFVSALSLSALALCGGAAAAALDAAANIDSRASESPWISSSRIAYEAGCLSSPLLLRIAIGSNGRGPMGRDHATGAMVRINYGGPVWEIVRQTAQGFCAGVEHSCVPGAGPMVGAASALRLCQGMEGIVFDKMRQVDGLPSMGYFSPATYGCYIYMLALAEIDGPFADQTLGQRRDYFVKLIGRCLCAFDLANSQQE